MTIDLDVLTSRLLPVTTHDTPDYAEVSFGDVKSQTMTMEPEIFLMLNALPDLIAAARERDGLRAEIKVLKAIKPREYDLTRSAEYIRMLREAHGYLQTGLGKEGTDFEGRKHCIAALKIAEAEAHQALQAGEKG